MRKLLLLLVVVLAVSVTIVPVTAQDMMENPSVHTECEVDLTGETISLYHFGDLSGAYAFITQPIIAAFDDAAAYFNEHGGICGAEVNHVFEDTGGDLQATQSVYDRFSAEYDPQVLLLYSSPDSELLREQVAEDGRLVLISAGSVEGLYGEDGQTPGWIYASNPLYVNQFGSFCDYVAANSEMYPEPVIGYISWPGAFGEAAFTEEGNAYCEGLGVEVVDEPQIFLPSDTDIFTQVQNLVDAGANILYTNTLATGPALVASTVVDLGLEDDVTVAGVNWVMDITVGLLGQTTRRSNGLPAVDGILGSMPFAWWSEAATNPGVAFVTQQAELNARTLPQRNIAYLLSWGSFDLFVEMYIQTVNRVGSLDAVTGADLRETINTWDFSPLGLWNGSYAEGFRDAVQNRIAVMRFLNADGTGPATSADDALVVETESGPLFIPIVIPLTDFTEVPNLRPGAMDG